MNETHASKVTPPVHRHVSAVGTGRTAAGSGPRVYRIVILGDGGVGKSALVMQFVNHRFLDYHDPTIEDAYVKQARIDGEPAKLDILDTAGQLEFTIMRETYMRHGEGFVICYSITDPRSFDEVLNHKKMIHRVRGQEDIPIIITGNKCDLEHLRKVTAEEGNRLAAQLNVPFFETSAVSRQCVDDVFHELVREIRRKEHEKIVAAEKMLKKQQRRKHFHSFFSRLNVFKRKSRPSAEDSK